MTARVSEAQLLQVYHDSLDAIYAYASRKCAGERALAEDVVQEAWLRAVKEWRRTGLPDSPQAWLFTVVRNLILNHMRRRPAVSIDFVSPAEVLAAVEANAVGDSPDVTAAVNAALLRIPAEESALLEAFHFQRLKTAQLAKVHGVSERAIEGRLRRARERLRAELAVTLKAEGLNP